MKTTVSFPVVALLLLFSCSGICGPENLVKGGSLQTPADLKAWETGHWVHIPANKGDYRLLIKEVSPFISRVLTDNGRDGRKALELISKGEFLQIRDNDGGCLTISNYLFQTVPAKPGKYLLSFWLKGKNGPAEGYNAVRCFLQFQNVSKKSVPPGIDRQFILTSEWVQQKVEFSVPENGISFTLRFSLYGVGEMFLDNVIVKPVR